MPFYYLKKFFAHCFPYYCILCGAKSERPHDLCGPCYHQLPWITHACQRCALPLLTSDTLCGACLKKPPPFDYAFANFRYQMPIIKLILELKFKHALTNAQVLGELLTDYLLNTAYANRPFPEAIVPVPLHVSRLKERGFNQATEIARPIAAAMQRPILLKACQRARATTPQAIKPAKARLSNVCQAFVVNEDFTGKHIAVIDDVITTGHTMVELCRVLKQQGVQTIDVWCSARSVFS